MRSEERLGLRLRRALRSRRAEWKCDRNSNSESTANEGEPHTELAEHDGGAAMALGPSATKKTVVRRQLTKMHSVLTHVYRFPTKQALALERM
jgi:hypothetical protein